jgi:hypothetical protein
MSEPREELERALVDDGLRVTVTRTSVQRESYGLQVQVDAGEVVLSFNHGPRGLQERLSPAEADHLAKLLVAAASRALAPGETQEPYEPAPMLTTADYVSDEPRPPPGEGAPRDA